MDRAERAAQQSAHDTAGKDPRAPHREESGDAVHNRHEGPEDDATEFPSSPPLESPQKQGQRRWRDREDERVSPPPQQHVRAAQQKACPAKRAAEQVLHRDDKDTAQFPWGDSAPPVALENEADHFSSKPAFIINAREESQPSDAHRQEPGLPKKDTTNMSGTDGELIDAQEDQSHETFRHDGIADSSIHSKEAAAVTVLCKPRKLAPHPASAHAHDESQGRETQHSVRTPLSLVRENGQGQVAAPQEAQRTNKSTRPNGCRALQKERGKSDRQAAHGVGVTEGPFCRDSGVQTHRHADGFKKKYLALMGGGGESISLHGPSRFLKRSAVSGRPFLDCALASFVTTFRVILHVRAKC